MLNYKKKVLIIGIKTNIKYLICYILLKEKKLIT